MQLASKPKVAIIGGGIIGCLTALYLRDHGARPVVIDKSAIGRESSWAGAGILCPIKPWLYPEAFTRLIEFSLRMYPDLEARLRQESGVEIQYWRCGMLLPFFPGEDAELQIAQSWAVRHAWRVDEWNSVQLRARLPVLSEQIVHALYWPDVAQVRNPRLLRAVRRCLEGSGVPLIEHSEVVGIHRKGDRVDGVVLEEGRVLHADALVLAAGSWSGLLGKRIGLDLPIRPVKGQIVLLHGEKGILPHIVKHDSAYLVPRQDGRILVGASMENVGFRAGNTVREVGRLLDSLRRIAPGLESLLIERMWMGFRPGTPDGLPYIGPVASMPGLWVASGHYRNGVALAPATAKILADWIMGIRPDLDLSPFRVGRPITHSLSLGFPTPGNTVAAPY